MILHMCLPVPFNFLFAYYSEMFGTAVSKTYISILVAAITVKLSYTHGTCSSLTPAAVHFLSDETPVNCDKL